MQKKSYFYFFTKNQIFRHFFTFDGQRSVYLSIYFIQQSNQYHGFQITEGFVGATATELAHKGLQKTTGGVEKATLFTN